VARFDLLANEAVAALKPAPQGRPISSGASDPAASIQFDSKGGGGPWAGDHAARTIDPRLDFQSTRLVTHGRLGIIVGAPR
jgi:hypothetical protein